MRIKYIYEFYDQVPFRAKAVLETEQPLNLNVGDELNMSELASRPLTIHKVEHFLMTQGGVVVCRTCIHC